jgi:lysophospholipase L1-like esterase
LIRLKSSRLPFCVAASLAVSAIAVLLMVLSTPVTPARAQAAQQAALSDTAKSENPEGAKSEGVNSEGIKGEGIKPEGDKPAVPTAGKPEQGNVAAVDRGTPPQPKSLTDKAIDKVKEVAKSATDIFSRVPCLPPKGNVKSFGSLPHVAGKLASGEPVVIIAFGSSSTSGFGTSSPEYSYPNRLAMQLHKQYPGADITVINRGRGGEDAPEMMRRLQSDVIDMKPDLVIWQVGTNAVLRNLDPDETASEVADGIARIQAAGADLVLVDPQYSPKVTEHPESASKMIKLLGKVARVRHVGVFPRFEVMRQWHEKQSLPIDSFVIADGLHMNDWGYACFAQLLGDDIIKSVGQIKLGINVPSNVQSYRPM